MQEETRICCCLPLETKVRDLDARLYLGMKCLGETFDFMLGQSSNLHKHMLRLKRPFLYFDNGLINDESFYERIIANQGVVISLAEEGGVFAKDWNSFLASNFDNVLRYVELYFSWGYRQKEILLKDRQNITEDKIVVSGHPRFDMRKPDFNDFYQALKSYGDRSIRTPFILFNTAFGRSNNQLDYDQLLSTQKMGRGSFFDMRLFTEGYTYQKELLRLFSIAIREIATALPEETVVIRPHPVEKIRYWQESFQDLNNVIVSREGTVQEWIVNAAIVIHHECTTAIEAFLDQKDVICYCPLFDEDHVQEVPVKISEKIADSESLLKRIRQSLAGQPSPVTEEAKDEKRRLISSIIANTNFDGTSLIAKSLHERVGSMRFTSRPKTFSERKGELRNYLRRVYYKYFRKNDAGMIRNRNKFPYLHQDELEQRIRLLRERDPQLSPAVVKQVDTDTYLVTSQ